MTPDLRITLQTIDRFWMAHGYAPSVRDICNLTRTNSNQVIVTRLSLLEGMGYISRAPRVARSVRLTQAGRQRLVA